MTVLRVENLTKRFGALVAVDRVNLSVQAGAIHSIIGPNGAGKTTLFRVISGEERPTAGRVVFQGQDITGYPPHRVPHLGIARSFQRTSIFPNFTVYENVWLAAYARTVPSVFTLVSRRRDAAALAGQVQQVLAELQLDDVAEVRARELSHGDQRVLEVAMALAAAPTMLLLDEPTAGLAAEGIRRVMAVIEALAGRYTILLIEHNMDVVMRLSHVISVMHFGRIIAEDAPEEIRQNAAVREAYLGRRR
jgi:branched-chain amino acid transport system ATP-binding protein